MNRKLWGAVVLCAGAAAVVGCDDITTDGLGGSGGGTGGSTTVASSSSSTSTSSASTTASSSTGGAACEVSDPVSDCMTACTALYDCGALTCNGAPLCPGVDGSSAQKSGFVNGCVTACNQQMAFIQQIDPMACDTTVDAVKMTNATWKSFCEGM